MQTQSCRKGVCVQGIVEQNLRALMADAEEKDEQRCGTSEAVLVTHVVRVGGEKGGTFHMLPGS